MLIVDRLQSFTKFVASPERLNEADDKRIRVLVSILDNLAACVTEIGDVEFDDEDYPPDPDIAYDQVYHMMATHFPELGEYAVPNEGKLAFADPWDDLADIYGDISDALWRFENTSETDGLWWLKEYFRIHWGFHLRQLQAYLHDFLYR